jgi:HEAT repeat protein
MLDDIERQLGSVDVDIRREAVLKLKGFREASDIDGAVKLIMRAMQDPNWRVRKTAVDTLVADYPKESYMPGLINLLQLDDNAGARNSSIEVFIKLGARAAGFLVEAFDTPDVDVRKFIIDILGQLGDRKSLSLLTGALNDEDENVRAAAVEYLGTMKEPSVVDALIEILREGDLWTAYPAADALGRIGDRRAVPALLGALDNKPLREPALRALGMIADESSADKIVALVEDGSKAVKHEALRALEMLFRNGVSEDILVDAIKGRFGESAFDILLGHTKSSRPEIRVSAILFLGLLKEEKALLPLLELSTEEEYSEDVRKALVYMGRERPDILMPLFSTEDAYHKRFICDVASEVAAPLYYDILERFLGDEDGHVRTAAAFGLSNIGDPKAVDKIKALLQDPYVDVQEAALKALGSLRDGLDMDEVIRDINTRDSVLRRNLVLLLGEIAPAGAVPVLGFQLKDEDVSVRRAVVTALSKIETPESFKYLSQVLTDEDSGIRVVAALSLGASGDESFIEDLILLLEDLEDMVKVAAIKALGRLGGESSVPSLIKMLTSENGFVVTAAIDAIGNLEGYYAREALRSMLNSGDKEVKRSAIRALSRFSDMEEDILRFVNDEDWAARVAAIESLEGHTSERVKVEIEKHYDTEEDPVVRKAMQKCLDA